jgi:hypothetical protein
MPGPNITALCALLHFLAYLVSAQQYLVLYSGGAESLVYDNEDSTWMPSSSTYYDDTATTYSGITNAPIFEPINFPFTFKYFGVAVPSPLYIDPNGALHTVGTPPCCQPYLLNPLSSQCSIVASPSCTFDSTNPTYHNYFDVLSPSLTDYYNWPGIPYNDTDGLFPSTLYSVSSDRATLFVNNTHLFTLYQTNKLATCPSVAAVRHSFKLSVFSSGRISFRYLSISDPSRFGCWVDTSMTSLSRIWMAGLRPSIAARANYMNPLPKSYGWNTTTGGIVNWMFGIFLICVINSLI